MLVVFSLIFVVDTKVIFRYDFVAPLKFIDLYEKSNANWDEHKHLNNMSVILWAKVAFRISMMISCSMSLWLSDAFTIPEDKNEAIKTNIYF